jgi:mannose-6-phosphate isomerase-like protein (cupin superfamily)
MKTNLKDFQKDVKRVKKNSRYDIYDFEMKNLTLSMTVLNPLKETRGHEHKKIDEVYICLEGKGIIQIDKEKFPFKKNDIITIDQGSFHKVINTQNQKLKFISIFQKYTRR